MVVDDTVITGSYNLSHSATENAENVVMIQDRELADRYDAYIDGLVGRYRDTNHGSTPMSTETSPMRQ
jgi:phosphatidylserine/phosphatidylglycerophosphate/cardiolipin synthase-like enzyme